MGTDELTALPNVGLQVGGYLRRVGIDGLRTCAGGIRPSAAVAFAEGDPPRPRWGFARDRKEREHG